ncbi:MAG: hypothetical protein ACRDBP_09825, partial [Luteolibacter sp.]
RMLAADVNSKRGVMVIRFLNARRERLEGLEKVIRSAAIGFSDPLTTAKEAVVDAETGELISGRSMASSSPAQQGRLRECHGNGGDTQWFRCRV